MAGVTFAAGAGAADAKQVSETRALIDGFASTLSAHDMTGFAALFAEDYVNHQMSAAVPPPLPGKTAKQNTLDFFAARIAGIPDLRVIVETSMVSTGKIAASFIYAGSHSGRYFGFEPTGRTLRFTSCDIFLVRNGLLAEHWGMGDMAGLLAQLRG
jgi:predicted ester cyclase